MKVAELIEELEKLPQDSRVFQLWDSCPRSAVNVVYECREGSVILADYNEDIYNLLARPKGNKDDDELEKCKTPLNTNPFDPSDEFDF